MRYLLSLNVVTPPSHSPSPSTYVFGIHHLMIMKNMNRDQSANRSAALLPAGTQRHNHIILTSCDASTSIWPVLRHFDVTCLLGRSSCVNVFGYISMLLLIFLCNFKNPRWGVFFKSNVGSYQSEFFPLRVDTLSEESLYENRIFRKIYLTICLAVQWCAWTRGTHTISAYMRIVTESSIQRTSEALYWYAYFLICHVTYLERIKVCLSVKICREPHWPLPKIRPRL